MMRTGRQGIIAAAATALGFMAVGYVPGASAAGPPATVLRIRTGAPAGSTPAPAGPSAAATAAWKATASDSPDQVGAALRAVANLLPQPHQWMARIDTLKVCENYGFQSFGFGPNGSYCMQMEVPVKYDGRRVELLPNTMFPGYRANGGYRLNGPDDGSATFHFQRVTAGLCSATALHLPDPNDFPDAASVQPEWCGLSDTQWANGWDFTGASFPVLMQENEGGHDGLYQPDTLYLPVTEQPRNTYNTGGQQTVQPGPVEDLYLGMNIKADVPYLADPWLPAISSYPWMRGRIDASGKLTCMVQGDPAGKLSDAFPDGASNCPPDTVVSEGEPRWLGGGTPGAATQIADLNQLAGIPLADLGEDPPNQAAQGRADIAALDKYFGTPGLVPAEGAVSTTPTPAGPPPTALAAWKATAGVVAVALGGDLRAVASDLPSSDSSEIFELNQLASLPLTGDTATQMSEAQKDVHDLDSFFGTPGFTPGG
jgi:hypothetical protein